MKYLSLITINAINFYYSKSLICPFTDLLANLTVPRYTIVDTKSIIPARRISKVLRW